MWGTLFPPPYTCHWPGHTKGGSCLFSPPLPHSWVDLDLRASPRRGTPLSLPLPCQGLVLAWPGRGGKISTLPPPPAAGSGWRWKTTQRPVAPPPPPNMGRWPIWDQPGTGNYFPPLGGQQGLGHVPANQSGMARKWPAGWEAALAPSAFGLGQGRHLPAFPDSKVHVCSFHYRFNRRTSRGTCKD